MCSVQCEVCSVKCAVCTSSFIRARATALGQVTNWLVAPQASHLPTAATSLLFSYCSHKPLISLLQPQAYHLPPATSFSSSYCSRAPLIFHHPQTYHLATTATSLSSSCCSHKPLIFLLQPHLATSHKPIIFHQPQTKFCQQQAFHL